ncbi:MAG TPA: glycosyltransferase [Geomonas sp.]|nr:glycosyltransferase [Geomonas sp.]
MKQNINIIEPTLSGEAGHCQSFVASLCGSAGQKEVRFTLWGGRAASLPAMPGADISLKRHFFRKIRRFQEFFLLRRLLARGERIFISTAGRVDLVLLNLAAAGSIPPQRVFCFFHWMRPSPKKLAYFRKIAQRHPELVIMGPTASVVDVFRECGFRHCSVVPYPITPRDSRELPAQPFRHLLFAGAARADKGFHHVVDLLALLAERHQSVPVALQTSGDHYDRHDPDTGKALQKLSTIGYPELTLTPQTLSSEEYFAMFSGAICLQPYNPADFADRISGITLDGLSMGAPVVTLAGTWMARVVERFEAGVVVDSPAPEALLEASLRIRDDYPRYQSNARRAGLSLQQEHSAGHLLELISAG